MGTTRILDNYRTSLISSKELLQVMATIYRSGVIQEDLLKRLINRPEDCTIKNVDNLFRANLISRLANDRWSTTPLGEELLAKIGISDAIISSFIAEQSIDEADRVFLDACAAVRSEANPSQVWDIVSLLRSASFVLNLCSHSNKEIIAKRLLYAIIIGLDHESQMLGGKAYCESVIKWHRDRNTEMWGQWLVVPTDYDFLCERALEDFKASNKLILFHQQTGEDTSHLLTWTRFLSTLSDHRDTSSLKDLYYLDKEIFSHSFDTLAHWKASFEKDTHEYLLLWSNQELALPVESASAFTFRLHLKEFFEEILTPDQESRLACINIEEDGALKIQSEQQPNALDHLAAFGHRLNNGEFDDLSQEDKSAICAKLKMLTNLAISRLAKQ